MAVTVTVPADDTLLTTVDAVIAQLGQSVAADADLVEAAVRWASDFAASYCDRIFAKQSYSETVRGYGGNRLMLTHRPITAVASVTYRGTALTDYSIDDAGAGMLYREQGWYWTATSFMGSLVGDPIPGSEQPTYTVVYTAGWDLPSAGDDRTLPYDIEAAAIELAKSFYLDRKRNPALIGKRVGDLGLNYGQAIGGLASGISPRALTFLSPYRSGA